MTRARGRNELASRRGTESSRILAIEVDRYPGREQGIAFLFLRSLHNVRQLIHFTSPRPFLYTAWLRLARTRCRRMRRARYRVANCISVCVCPMSDYLNISINVNVCERLLQWYFSVGNYVARMVVVTVTFTFLNTYYQCR